MFRSRLTRSLALGTGALAAGALVFAIAPSATATGTATAADTTDDSTATTTTMARHGAAMDRPYFGARIVATTDGATVVNVIDGSPADTAGLETGDLVVSIDGLSLEDRASIREALQGAAAGDKLSIVYTHDGSEKTTSMTVGSPEDRPAPPAAEDVAWMGAHLGQVGTSDSTVVRNVVADGPAAVAGLQEGDVVTAIDGQEITDSWQVREILRGMAPGDSVTVTVDRDGASTDVTVKLGSAADAPARPAGGEGQGPGAGAGDGSGPRGGGQGMHGGPADANANATDTTNA